MKEDLEDLYEKLRMMLYAATHTTMELYDTSKHEFKVLHYLLRIAVHGGLNGVSFPNDFTHSVLLLAKFIQRTDRAGMFRERDEMGSLPLHIAVMGRGLLKLDHDCGDCRDSTADVVADNGDEHEQQGRENVDVEMDEAAEHNDEADPIQHPQRRQQMPPLADDNDDDDPQEDEEEDDMGDIDEADMDEHDNEASSSQSCGMEIIKLLLEQHPASIRLYDTQTRSLPIHLLLKHNSHATEAIDHFLHLYPKSAEMPDGEGRLPIHIALLHNSPSWENILEMAPNTLEMKDPMTGLLPFQLAGLSNHEKFLLTKDTPRENPPPLDETTEDERQELESFSMCFQLLRRNPHLASGMAEVPSFNTANEQVVIRLERENTMLRQRVYELEQRMMEMELSMQSSNGNALKKRKSFNAMDYFSRAG